MKNQIGSSFANSDDVVFKMIFGVFRLRCGFNLNSFAPFIAPVIETAAKIFLRLNQFIERSAQLILSSLQLYLTLF